MGKDRTAAFEARRQAEVVRSAFLAGVISGVLGTVFIGVVAILIISSGAR